MRDGDTRIACSIKVKPYLAPVQLHFVKYFQMDHGLEVVEDGDDDVHDGFMDQGVLFKIR